MTAYEMRIRDWSSDVCSSDLPAMAGTAALVIDGKAIAAALRLRIADAVPAFMAAAGRAPGLAVVLVGDDPASGVYVASKGKATRAAGMASLEHRLPADAPQAEVVDLIDRLTSDAAVHGLLLQMQQAGQLDTTSRKVVVKG